MLTGLPVSICGEGGGGREVMGNDGKRIHEKHREVNRAKCTRLFELIGSHEHCVYLAAYPQHSVYVYIRETGPSQSHICLQ